jgi:colanic acid/amylovoran biosynthesis glycosyltransferase
MLQLPRVGSPRTWGPSLRPLFRAGAARRRAMPLVRDLRQGHWLVPIAAGGYDIIHFEFSGIAAAVAEVLPRLRPARLVVSCRGAAEQIAPHRERDRARQLERVFSEVDLIHCVSDDMAATVRGYGAPAEKILVNRPAVDIARWEGVARVAPEARGSSDAPLRVLSVARLHWKKAFDDAVRAMAAARSAGVHVEYRIAGAGEEREKLLYLRHSLGLEEEVDLVGWQSQQQVEDLLGWADVFLLPSLSEGISNSALEAMAAGLPVVSTRCGGMAEALCSPQAGLLVDVGATDQMVGALRSLTDPAQRQALAAGGAAAAREGFDLSRQAAVFASAYWSLLAPPRPVENR